jgi:hypothetical protein
MGSDRRLRSPLAPTTQIRFRMSRFCDLGRQPPLCSKLPRPDFRRCACIRSMGPDRGLRFPLAPTVQCRLHISQFRISQLGYTTPSMLEIPKTRIPDVSLRQIYGTSSTIVISFSIDGPDLPSHFAILRLGHTTPSMLQIPEARIPNVCSRQIYGTKSTVVIFFSTDGLDPPSHFVISRLG